MKTHFPPPLALLALVLALSSGCQSMKDYGYKRPYDFANRKIIKHDYRSIHFRTNYDALVASGRANEAATERNAILSELMYLIDASHGEFERDAHFWKAAMDFAGDLAVIGVNGAGTVAGGAATKSILHVVSGGIVGSQLAVNKRLLQDQAMEAIQAQMRAGMKERKAEIISSMADDVTSYPLEMGLSDIVNYYYDGTITRALQNMVQSAKNNETNAEAKVKDAKGLQ